MSTETIQENKLSTKLSIRDIAAFCKLRLATLVVMSAAFCFVLASKSVNYSQLIILIIGGFLVTASSNGFNQIIERNLDKLMTRTQNRPLPSGRMTLNQAYFIASTLGIFGIILLWVFINPLSGVLGTLALVLYTFVYTPMKQKTPLAVFVGAFPGAIPPMLGYVAVTGEMSLAAVIVFSVQFMWQFPHFWAIAWVLDDDYKKAGFYMLPSKAGRDKSSAFQVLIYTLCLLPVSLMPIVFNISGSIAAIIIIICGIIFIAQAIKLFTKCDVKSAQQLMFGSFFYLPVVQIALMIDKV
ncbi:MAG TPA: heme o synthase [Bacteroidia bacterium]|nr:heme o synthase [Bacteroidia bacterium]